MLETLQHFSLEPASEAAVVPVPLVTLRPQEGVFLRFARLR
ncbi:hypothetical protein [Hymenobacter sp. 5516J-16]